MKTEKSTSQSLSAEEQNQQSRPLAVSGSLQTNGFVKESTNEWDYMWNKLAENPMNSGFSDPKSCENDCECWQYMDTSNYDGNIQHCFRHKNHPGMSNTRQYIRIPVSSDFDVNTDLE